MAAIDAQRRITRQSFQKTPSADSRVGTCKLPARPPPKKISVARLSVTGSDVFGREEEIAFLDRAWVNQDVNVVTIVGWAGVGKSTLVNHWLRRMAAEHYRSAELVFGWSFYRQGTSTGSADEFFADHEQTSTLRRDLEQLSSDAGAKLLRALGVKGDEAELRNASDEFSGHCLALTLLGSYLTDAHNGDVRGRKEVSERLGHDVRPAGGKEQSMGQQWKIQLVSEPSK